MPEVGELLQALAALEHEVLEEVREARAALRLGAEADVDVHGDADDRGGGSGTTSTRRPFANVARCSSGGGTPRI